MADDPEIGIAAIDVAELQRWLDDPEAPIVELMALLPFLKTEAGAQSYLKGIREGLADIRAGRTVPHEQVVREAEERRRRWQQSAAE